MNAAEYEEWFPKARKGYAADMIDAGIAADVATAKAETDFANLLPQGAATPGQDVYTIESDGHPVGDLWLCERENDGGKVLFIYDVQVNDDQRGKGLGRAAMVFVEEEARRRGLPRVALNVFGGNAVARGLYLSLGYNEVAVWMEKQV